MRPIEVDTEYVTIINVLTAEEPEYQQRIVDLITEFFEEHASQAPGFGSAAVHRSSDGVHVAIYVRWESVEASERFQAESPEAAALIEEVAEVATYEQHPYDVVATFEASGSEPDRGRS